MHVELLFPLAVVTVSFSMSLTQIIEIPLLNNCNNFYNALQSQLKFHTIVLHKPKAISENT